MPIRQDEGHTLGTLYYDKHTKLIRQTEGTTTVATLYTIVSTLLPYQAHM